eukprot:510328-Prymnesium_polylepis.1
MRVPVTGAQRARRLRRWVGTPRQAAPLPRVSQCHPAPRSCLPQAPPRCMLPFPSLVRPSSPCTSSLTCT